MKVAMLPAAALVSSAVFEMVSLVKSSSSTLTDFWFSDFVVAAVEGADSMMSADGIMLIGWMEGLMAILLLGNEGSNNCLSSCKTGRYHRM
jgi:hypothetical protein